MISICPEPGPGSDHFRPHYRGACLAPPYCSFIAPQTERSFVSAAGNRHYFTQRYLMYESSQ